ncbi:hypothetical protein [Streptomyces hygroscopicus]|uniref:hypothetical protein n=1 Tax=Streptomyces hygroscopicus TaxID=1912 RepID=UPI001FCACABF|nr:hypothetical protein [Streptomyces hygroscopicus]BDH10286.1 hypothetical protein HOK021_14650 [Streptomyces hygroscopicus]
MRDKNGTNRRGGVLRRTAAAASLTLIVGALPVALATPASASQGACESYLASKGYKVGKWVKKACAVAASDTGAVGDSACRSELWDLGVKEPYASEACDRA